MNNKEISVKVTWEQSDVNILLSQGHQKILNKYYEINSLHSELISNLQILLEYNPTEEALKKLYKKVWKLYSNPTGEKQLELNQGENIKQTIKDFLNDNKIITINFERIPQSKFSHLVLNTRNSLTSFEKHTFIILETQEKERDFQLLNITTNFQKLIVEIKKEIQISIDNITPIKSFSNQTQTTHGLTLNELGVLGTKGEKQERQTIYKKGNTIYSIPFNYMLATNKGEKKTSIQWTSQHLHFLIHLLGNIKIQEKQTFDLIAFMEIMGMNIDKKQSIYDNVHRLKQMFNDLIRIRVSHTGNNKNAPYYEQRGIFQNTFKIINNQLEYYLETKFVEDIKRFPTNFVLPMGITKIPLIEKIHTRMYLKLFSHYVQNYKKNTVEGTLSVKSLGASCDYSFTKHLDREIETIFTGLEKLVEYGILKIIGFKDNLNFYKSFEEISNFTNREKSELFVIYIPQDLSINRQLKED